MLLMIMLMGIIVLLILILLTKQRYHKSVPSHNPSLHLLVEHLQGTIKRYHLTSQIIKETPSELSLKVADDEDVFYFHFSSDIKQDAYMKIYIEYHISQNINAPLLFAFMRDLNFTAIDQQTLAALLSENREISSLTLSDEERISYHHHDHRLMLYKNINYHS